MLAEMAGGVACGHFLPADGGDEGFDGFVLPVHLGLLLLGCTVVDGNYESNQQHEQQEHDYDPE